MTEALNPEPLLRTLHEARVRHIIIGGFAVNAHGVIRPSRDLDIVPDPDPANLRRLADLLTELGARHVGLGDFKAEEFPFDPTDPVDLEAGANFRLETDLGDLGHHAVDSRHRRRAGVRRASVGIDHRRARWHSSARLRTRSPHRDEAGALATLMT